VLDLVAQIPSGRVMTYGDVAVALGAGGPRAVGSALARWGSGVPWHRVLQASGHPAKGHEREALRRFRRERTKLLLDGERVDLATARWSPPRCP
jgi:alkylated DNA nucleotide flippase Atl1